jgi:methionyl-tRNA synthetase
MKYYITTPIYYVNAKPHIGHAYTTVAADALARWHRMLGEKVFLSTGTDEHGQKIEDKAREAGKEPKVFADEIAEMFMDSWKKLGIKYDRFIRTTDEVHIKAVQGAITALYAKGDIYLGEYEGFYCKGCEQFKGEKDLVDGKCPEHNIAPELLKEESYMFRLSKYKDVVYDRIAKDEMRISPQERRNEILSFIKNEGLKDVSFSRKNIKWGIPLPWDNSHTIYVWADALLNYLTALGWNGEPEKAPEMWPADLQIMSKDILRVHATIWPAMLLAIGLALPREIFVHGFFLVNGQKMSKTLGNVIAPEELVSRYGKDGARYLLLSSSGYGHDSDLSLGRLDEKFNAELANGIGNLFGRVVSLTEKYADGCIPERVDDLVLHDEGAREQLKFSDALAWTWDALRGKYAENRLSEVLETIASVVAMCDRHISAISLWKFIKDHPEEGKKHLYALLETLRQIALMLNPAMPEVSSMILNRLGLDADSELKNDFDVIIKWGGLSQGAKVDKGEGLFPRIEAV